MKFEGITDTLQEDTHSYMYILLLTSIDLSLGGSTDKTSKKTYT
jgi:hypothetical protein